MISLSNIKNLSRTLSDFTKKYLALFIKKSLFIFFYASVCQCGGDDYSNSEGKFRLKPFSLKELEHIDFDGILDKYYDCVVIEQFFDLRDKDIYIKNTHDLIDVFWNKVEKRILDEKDVLAGKVKSNLEDFKFSNLSKEPFLNCIFKEILSISQIYEFGLLFKKMSSNNQKDKFDFLKFINYIIKAYAVFSSVSDFEINSLDEQKVLNESEKNFYNAFKSFNLEKIKKDAKASVKVIV